jgi:hypothetical protein
VLYGGVRDGPDCFPLAVDLFGLLIPRNSVYRSIVDVSSKQRRSRLALIIESTRPAYLNEDIAGYKEVGTRFSRRRRQHTKGTHASCNRTEIFDFEGRHFRLRLIPHERSTR